ncbi:hypothetical protein ABW20_dc0108341 [Dactylellina cionopaga]|nr:hypothetical protein ABW20_dc0108341 [Dactylellina cionopaga]
MAQSLWRRGVQEDLASLPETLKSWDACMAKDFCKYPVIAGCVVGALVLISIAWCCYRCCCRRRRKAARSKSTFFNDPVPAYMSHGDPSTGGGSIGHGGSSYNQPAAPQYAYFENGTTGGKNADDLPVMPSWNGAKSEKVEDTTVKVEDIELGEVDSRKHQKPQEYSSQKTTSSSPPPSNRQNFPPSNNLNPFGPQRLNSPFGPTRVVPPARTQSPYPEGNTMPTAPNVLPYNGNAAPSHEEFDFSPHINAHNQGPYANADIYPPEASYQQQFTGVTPTQPQQFTGTTNSATPAPYQQPTYTGTTVSESYTQPAPLSVAAHQLPYQQPPSHLNTTNPSNPGFVAQMDDDYGHSPVHLANPNGVTNNVGRFDHNEFDHGGYSNYNQPAANNYQRQPQQGWTAF